jgi:hypothetical protein
VLDSNNDSKSAWEKALDSYTKLGGQGGDIAQLTNTAQCLISMTQIIHEIAQLMHRVLKSTFKPDVKSLESPRKKLAEVRTRIADIGGEEAVQLTKTAESLSHQINNLERLTKTTKGDFGKFSGLVSAAAFFPLFFGISWIITNFDISIDSTKLLVYSIAFSLISGFGTGAVKFLSLFNIGSANKEAKKE